MNMIVPTAMKMNKACRNGSYNGYFEVAFQVIAADERNWRNELTAIYQAKLDASENYHEAKAAIDHLLHLNADYLKSMLIEKMASATHQIKIALAVGLWKTSQYERSFFILFDLLYKYRSACLNSVFAAFQDMSDCRKVRSFALACLEGDDEELFRKAHFLLTLWGYIHIPALRSGNLVGEISLRSRQTQPERFRVALERIKNILRSR
jgi:hypothetical protein